MNKFDVIEWKKRKQEQYKLEREQLIEECGPISRFSQDEFNKSIKMANQYRKSGTTRRTHSKGNLWNHNNLSRERFDIVINNKIVKY